MSPESIEIIDLDKETITQIDVQRKTYTVVTFDQIKQQVENARQQMEKQPPSQPAGAQPTADPNVKMSFDVKVRKTGAQKEISGLHSSEAILTMTMTATAQQSQQSGAMAITNDMWMVPAIPGYDQVRDFYRRMAGKMSDSSQGLGYDFSKMLAQNPGASAALSDMAKEMQKLDGVPIMQVMRMGTTLNGQPLPAASEAPTPTSPAGPSGGDVAKQRNDFCPRQPHSGLWRFRQEEAAGSATGSGSECGPGTSSEFHIDGDADHDFQFLVGGGRSFPLRHPGRL